MSEACGRAQVAPPQLFDRKYSRFEPAQTCKPLESPHLSNKWHQLDKGLHPKRVGVIVDASQLFALFHWGYWQWMSIMSAFFHQFCPVLYRSDMELPLCIGAHQHHGRTKSAHIHRVDVDSGTYVSNVTQPGARALVSAAFASHPCSYVRFFVWLDRLRAHHFCITSSVLRRGATKILPSVLAKLGLG